MSILHIWSSWAPESRASTSFTLEAISEIKHADKSLLCRGRSGYGGIHPGVCVNPSHHTIAIARSEGHIVYIYLGVSAEDCLFPEVGVDPSCPGRLAPSWSSA